MSDLRKAAEMAWNYFRNAEDITVEGKHLMEALRQALAQPEHTAWVTAGEHTVPLKTYPPKREWVGLTDEEFMAIAQKYSLPTRVGLEYFKDELEAKLKEKNGYPACPPCTHDCNEGRDCPARKVQT